MKLVWLWFKWILSNSGVVRGSRGKAYMDNYALLTYSMGKHPLVKKTCRYCNAVYWAFAKGNRYCGQFVCFKRMYER